MKLFKRIVCFLMVVTLCCTSVMAEEASDSGMMESYYWDIESNHIEGWPQGPAVQCETAILMDLDTGAILYNKGSKTRMYPASTTKVMTALLILDYGNLDEVVTFTEDIYSIPEDSSSLYIKAGEQLTLRQCLYGIMLASANDICVGVAIHIAGSHSGFVEMMNRKAQELGCVDTHFVNSHGYHDENHYTTAYDLALIAQAAYAYPDFRDVVKTTEATYPATNLHEENSFENHHKMILPYSDYYYDKCTGGKTGYTDAAWCTLVTFAENGEEKLVTVTMRNPQASDNYVDTTNLMEYGFNNFHHETIPGGADKNELKTNYQQAFQETLADNIEVSLPETSLVTIPNTGSVQSVIRSYEKVQNKNCVIDTFNGQTVGIEPLTLTEVKLPETEAPAETEAVETEAQTEAKKDIGNEVTSTPAIKNVGKAIMFVAGGVKDFVTSINMVKIIILIVIAVILIVMIVLYLKRSTGRRRKQKARELEEVERLKKEEDIDNETLQDIERELRAALDDDDDFYF